MKKKYVFSFLGALALFSIPLASIADQNVTEKAQQDVNTANRNLKQKRHHVHEAACRGSAAKCAGEKIKNRTKEGSDYLKDKAQETKDKAD